MLALAAALLTFSASCSGGGGSAGSGPSSSGPAAQPKPGGKVIFGTEAEIDGFDPTKNRWDATGLQYAGTVFDPLAAFDANGEVKPYLAEKLDHNADYTVWTVKVRSGVKFHDGTPLTSDAVKLTLDGDIKSPLTGPGLASIASVDKVDDLTVDVKMKQPWVPFPVYLTGQTGVVVAPSMLANPEGSRHPVGTGPFVFKEWIPGNHFIATKNPNYWRPGLPLLDEIEYRPIVESESRVSSLKAGTIDAMHTSDAQAISDLRDDKNLIKVEQTTGETEEGFLMINTAVPPLDDVRVRKALAYATDKKKLNDVINFGIFKLADGPFGEGSKFNGPTGYPAYDPAKAKELVQQYEREKGKITFKLGTTNAGRSLQLVQLIQDQWKQVGIEVQIDQVEQSQFIGNALLGQYQVYTWRQFGVPDPDGEYVWWSTGTAMPVGQLALNFARNKDDQIQKNLDIARTNPDPNARKAAYQEIAKRFSEDVPYIWEWQTLWAFSSKPEVQGVNTPTLPDGGPRLGFRSGIFSAAELWRSTK